MQRAGCVAKAEEQTERPQDVVSQILRDHGLAVSSSLTWQQIKVMNQITRCRTAALGGRLYSCNSCDYQLPLYNSCRNRHCPTCQSPQQARWILQRMERVLPCSHIHAVFTLPGQLRQLCYSNQRELYGLLFRCASQTLQELAGNEARLGARLGMTAVLHTWTRKLDYHPHLHCLVTAGGLSLDGKRWIHSVGEGRFLFPVKVIARLFRGKFLAGLDRLYEQGSLKLDGGLDSLRDSKRFATLKNQLYAKEWVVYAKRPFAGPEQVYRYLGRYTHRVGISPQRIVSYDGERVQFRTRGAEEIVLTGPTFVRRFLRHVLPKRFTKIRHFGLYAAGNVNTRLETARELLVDSKAEDDEPQVEDLLAYLELIDADTPKACPQCKVGVLKCVEFLPGQWPSRTPEPDI